MTGWIKLHRKMMDWEWFQDPLTAHLFLYMILKANRFPDSWRGITINAGQFVTSIGKLSEKTGLSVQQVRTCMKRLKSTQELTQKSTSGFTILTICNYSSYQIDDDCINTEVNTVSNMRSTCEQHASNMRSTTNKESKKVIKKERKKENTVFVPPTFEEAEEFCKSKGFGHIARRAFDHYDLAGWTDTNGKQVKNWQRKFSSVWFDSEKNPAPKKELSVHDMFVMENPEACRKAMDDAAKQIERDRQNQDNTRRDELRESLAKRLDGELQTATTDDTDTVDTSE